MANKEEIVLADEYAKEAKDGRGKPGWYEKRDPSLQVAPHHQEAAMYGQSSHVRTKEEKQGLDFKNYAPDRTPDPRWGKDGKGGVSGEAGLGMGTDVVDLEASIPEIGNLRLGILDDSHMEMFAKGDADSQTVKETADFYNRAIDEMARSNGDITSMNVEKDMERIWQNVDKEKGKKLKEDWDDTLDKREKTAKATNNQRELQRISLQRDALQKSYTRWYGRK